MSSNRLDKYVVEKFPQFSRGQSQKLIETGKILVNGKCSKSSYLCKDSDEVHLVTTKKSAGKNSKLGKDLVDFPVLYEDAECIVINKRAGVSVYPINEADKSITIVDFSLQRFKAKFKDPDRPGIVHRLDKETSGVLILAKNQEALEYLMAEFKNREVKKVYIALVYGILQHHEGIIDSPIARSHKHRKKMSLAAEGTGRQAISQYKVLKEFRVDPKHMVSLLEIRIHTGRTHQIRVHMSSIGHPVIGDVTYGNPSMNRMFIKKFGLRRQFLHASLVEFKTPVKDKQVSVLAELPDELKNLETRLQLF